MRKPTIHGGLSIAMLDDRRVTEKKWGDLMGFSNQTMRIFGYGDHN